MIEAVYKMHFGYHVDYLYVNVIVMQIFMQKLIIVLNNPFSITI